MCVSMMSCVWDTVTGVWEKAKDDLKTLKSAKSLFVNLQFYLLIVRSNCILVTLRPISLTVLESQGGSSLHLLPTAFDVERQAPGTFLQSIKFIKHLFLDMICLPWISKSQKSRHRSEKSRHSRRQSYLLQAPAEGISPGLHMLQGPRLRHTVKFRTNLTHRCYRSYLLSHCHSISCVKKTGIKLIAKDLSLNLLLFTSPLTATVLAALKPFVFKIHVSNGMMSNFHCSFSKCTTEHGWLTLSSPIVIKHAGLLSSAFWRMHSTWTSKRNDYTLLASHQGCFNYSQP